MRSKDKVCRMLLLLLEYRGGYVYRIRFITEQKDVGW